MVSNTVSKFGRVALDLGYLNIKQLEECLQLQIDFQKAGKDVPRLGSLLLSKKYITSKQLETILERQKDAKYENASASSSNILKFFPAGTYIFKEGTKSDGMLYLIHDATIDIYRNDERLDTLTGKGKFFGEVAFLTSSIYTESAVASKDSNIFVIPGDEVEAFLRNRPEMGLRIAKRIAANLHKLVLKDNPQFETETDTDNIPTGNKPVANHTPPEDNTTTATQAERIKLNALKSQSSTSNVTLSVSPEKPVEQSLSPAEIIKQQAMKNKSKSTSNDTVDDSGDSTSNATAEKPALTPAELIKQQAMMSRRGEVNPDNTESSDSAIQNPGEQKQEATPLSPAELIKQQAMMSKSGSNILDNSPSNTDEDDIIINLDDDTDEAVYHEDEPELTTTDQDIVERNDDSHTPKQTENSNLSEPPLAVAGKLGSITISPLESFDYNETALVSSEVDVSDLLERIKNLNTQPFSREIVSSVKDIVKLYVEIDQIDQERTEYIKSLPELTEILKNEINRQKKEMIKLPPYEALSNSYSRLRELIENDSKDQTDKNQSDKPAEGGDSVKEKIDTTLLKAYKYSLSQKEILIKRYTSIPDVISTCFSYSEDEPLYQTLLKYGVDAKDLFGWGIYSMALEEYSAIQTEKVNIVRGEREELEQSLKSLVGRLKLNKKIEEEREERFNELVTQEKKYKLIQTIVRREHSNIEKMMVDEFWKIYQAASYLLLGEIDSVDKVMLKCFLRWGLTGYSKKWIDFSRCEEFITQCSAPLKSPLYSTSSTYIYYSDEIIELTAKGYLPTSPNEDLELNHRNTPEWRSDKAYKRYCYLKMQYSNLHDVLQAQNNEITRINEKLNAAQQTEIELMKSRSKTQQHRERVSGVKQEIQGYKVRSARINNIVARIENEMIPNLLEDCDSALTSIEKSGVKLYVSKIIEHEFNCIRRTSRLVAKLKEPFLPFVLRDSYKTDNDIVNSREYLQSLIDNIETLDPLLFQTKLVPSAKKKQRVLIRKSPVIAITPSCGILGFVISPRSGLENGRLTLPGYYEKSMISKEVLHTTLADFRFDCSKADAGVDIMTSDTLVAAYSTYRWNMRKKKKEVRKKAAVYLDETERLNWRRHYLLYANSALESGKFLFFKCPDLYDVIINKFIDLPAGCEKLKR